MAFRVGVLISGEGTNLQAILDELHGREGIEVVCVGSSRTAAAGLERARSAGVETAVFAQADYEGRAARDDALGAWLLDHSVDLVVLAGFMEVLGGAFIRRFEGRIINVHPSLLPAFAGVRAIEQALDYGVRVTGVTVHYVEEEIDAGPVILQEALELPGDPEIEDVRRRLQAIEHRLLPRALRLIASGAVSLDPADKRRVRVSE
ncbi:MAG: phosphoribosylglycinamide formyltransferase [Actinomycetota bacterium]|nr:phosphoribosylglycinamide formyltransferase [Actinomycetota bacterium]